MKIRILGTICGLCLAALVLPACSTEKKSSDQVDESRLFGDYSLSIDDEEGTVKAVVQFRERSMTGPVIELAQPSRVTFNDEVMKFLDPDSNPIARIIILPSLAGAFYLAEQKLSAVANADGFRFSWYRRDGEVFSQELKPLPSFVIRASSLPRKVDRQSALVVETTQPVGEHEKNLSCRLAMNQDHRNYEANGGFTSENTCVISMHEIANFPPGKAHITVIFKDTLRNASGHERAGGKVTITRTSAKAVVEL